METAQRDIPQQAISQQQTAPQAAVDRPAPDEPSVEAPQAAAAHPQQAQAAQPEAAPIPEADDDVGRTAAAGNGEDGEGRASVLSEFLTDGPPQAPDDGVAPADQRPVQLQPQQDADEAQPDAAQPEEGQPMETAAEPPPPSGGGSVYEDSFGTADRRDLDLDPVRTLEPLDGPILPESEDPVFLDQFGAPVVLSSLPATELSAPVLDVPVPPPAPALAETDPEIDPLTALRLASPEEEDGDEVGEEVVGTADDDDLSGTAGDDTIFGDAGDDTLSGDAGDDTLTGDDGGDVFSFSLADDIGDNVITDFDSGEGDVLRLSDVTDIDGDSDFDLDDLDDPAAGNDVSGTPASVELSFGTGGSISLSGVDGSGIDSFTALDASGVTVDVA